VSRKGRGGRKFPASSKPDLVRNMIWASRFLALVGMPILIFAGLETGLRLVGFGRPPDSNRVVDPVRTRPPASGAFAPAEIESLFAGCSCSLVRVV